MLDNAAQTACTSTTLDGTLSHGTQGSRLNFQLHTFHTQQLLELLDQGIARLGQNADQCVFVQLFQRGDYRQTPYQLGDQTKLNQILGFSFRKQLAHTTFGLGFNRGRKTNTRFFSTVADHLFQAIERTTHDEQNVGGVHLDKVLVGMLAPTLWRHRSHGTFDQLEQRLLHTLARDVTGDRRVIRLTGNFIDFVDVDNGALRLFHIVIAVLQQFLNDVFNVFTHVTSFGQGGSVGHHKRNIQHAGQGLGQQRFARTRRPDQQNITFGQLDIIAACFAATNAFVVVIDRYRQGTLGRFLANNIPIQKLFDFLGGRQFLTFTIRSGARCFVTNDIGT